MISLHPTLIKKKISLHYLSKQVSRWRVVGVVLRPLSLSLPALECTSPPCSHHPVHHLGKKWGQFVKLQYLKSKTGMNRICT